MYNFVSPERVAVMSRYRESAKEIKELFSRDNMKVVFFGRYYPNWLLIILKCIFRTSNGKSTVINAMLGAKVLPQGIGHTTCCFLQVEGSPDDEKYLLREGSNERIEINV